MRAAGYRTSLPKGGGRLRRYLMALTATVLLVVGPVSAVSAQETDTGTETTTTTESDSDAGLWGLTGLLGLAGLAGLMRRDRRDETRYDQGRGETQMRRSA
jgi:MYXO-CTERM domain-containing protein